MKKILLTIIILVGIISMNAYAGTQDSLQQYTGKYKFPDGSVVTDISVTLENGVLTGSSAMGSSELKRTEGDVFQIVAYGGIATFKRNADGKVNAVQVAIGDLNLEGTKTEGLVLTQTRYRLLLLQK